MRMLVEKIPSSNYLNENLSTPLIYLNENYKDLSSVIYDFNPENLNFNVIEKIIKVKTSYTFGLNPK